MIKVNHITGVNTANLDQGTEEWLKHRAGVITASRAHEVIKKTPPATNKDKASALAAARALKKLGILTDQQVELIQGKPSKAKGSYTQARKSYMFELIAQICTGLVPESVSFKQAVWGHDNEVLARESYEAITMRTVAECGLIYRDKSLRTAISPDGLVLGERRGLEIKNPFTTPVHLETLFNGIIKPEYITQCQFSMWVADYEHWDFCSYDYRIKGKAENRVIIIPQYRDEKLMKTFDEEIPKFCEEMDLLLDRIGFKFGEQWEINKNG